MSSKVIEVQLLKIVSNECCYKPRANSIEAQRRKAETWQKRPKKRQGKREREREVLSREL